MSRSREPGRRCTRGNALRGRRRAHGHGQSLVEFALVLPVLLLILLVALDSGRVFLGWVELNNAARIAANHAASHPDADWSDPADPDRIRYEALITQEAAALGCILASPIPAPEFLAGSALGEPVRAGFSCAFDVLTPLIGAIVGDPLTISASSVYPIRTGSFTGTPVGTALPSATPAPSVTPAPTPTPCLAPAPNYVSIRVNTASADWTGPQPFTGMFTALGSGNYLIGWQSLVAGQEYPCDTDISVARVAP